MQFRKSLQIFYSALILAGCQPKPDLLFTKTELAFENQILETPQVNILSYEYTYNGGGVAAGDFNNDGWCDLYFTGNTVPNKLFLNEGDFKFKDITNEAGVGGRELWKTGVTTVDINADGWLDIYVCYSGPELGQSFSNQLFVNNGIDKEGIPTFTDRAIEYGLDAPGTFSTQALFFDYDRDGDLDMFLVNHANHFFSPFVNTKSLRNTRHPQFGNRLYRNDSVNNRIFFSDVSEQAGIHGGGINFGLGVSAGDFNQDGWPDLYLSNDYEEQDFLYINNKDGSFTNATKKSLGHFSRNGMGTDVADYNNDGRPDIIEVDMWPEDNFRQKLLRGPDDYNRYQLMLDSGFLHQQMRNTLQLNSGVLANGLPVFSEVGQLAGVSSTDWSWAPLFVDLDNDGYKDLFVSNGYLRDFTSLDFLKYTVEEARTAAKKKGAELNVFELVSKMASTKTNDYVFQNKGDLTFQNVTTTWGLATPNLSFGATYADLDNDGDLEIITNNTNELATIWKNNSESIQSRNYLAVQLIGPRANPLAIGASVKIETHNQMQMLEQYLTRGFQSSVDPILHFGLGNETEATVTVTWPDGKITRKEKVAVNTKLEIGYNNAGNIQQTVKKPSNLFTDYTTQSGVNFIHRENTFMDYDREPLLLYQLSKAGPALAHADVNADGYEDFFVGGAIGQSGKLFLGIASGQFLVADSQPWLADILCEDVSAIFFDVDQDGDEDFFVVSGDTEYPTGSALLDDRLYLNDGRGKFSKAPVGSIVADHANGSCVAAADYDQDGDLDLFVGGASQPGNFPYLSPGAILKNESTNGQIKFSVSTVEVNPELRTPGIVTDALWTDFNTDGWPDLILVGKCMPVRVFANKNGKLVEIQSEMLQKTTGLWNRIAAADLDNDGDLDYVLGNAGANLPWKISAESPLTLYYADFDQDGKTDPIIFYTYNGKQYPVASRDELVRQLPALKKKFTTYSAYAMATVNEILEPAQLASAGKLNVNTVQSMVLKNLGNNQFEIEPLPIEAQFSAVTAITINDFDNDSQPDILLAGNFFPYNTQYGPADASQGLWVKRSGKTFTAHSWNETGFFSPGDVRNMKLLHQRDETKLIVQVLNNDSVRIFKVGSYEE
ncbi:MAG: VCBS repeat-containing protein [Cyclobacteriaceae bacterium]|nr:VCBS repeat-containing protein [Cyclobacteriaceae bacterium]